jgi:hypothetical protein
MKNADPDVLAVLKTMAAPVEEARLAKLKAKHNRLTQRQVETQLELLAGSVLIWILVCFLCPSGPMKAKKAGRPKLPKGAAMGRIVPVRFNGDDLKAIAARARASNQNVSEWIRSTIHASLQS